MSVLKSSFFSVSINASSLGSCSIFPQALTNSVRCSWSLRKPIINASSKSSAVNTLFLGLSMDNCMIISSISSKLMPLSIISFTLLSGAINTLPRSNISIIRPVATVRLERVILNALKLLSSRLTIRVLIIPARD